MAVSPLTPSLWGRNRAEVLESTYYFILESHLPSKLPPTDPVPLQSPGWVSHFELFWVQCHLSIV